MYLVLGDCGEMKEQWSIQHRESLVSFAKVAGISVPDNPHDLSTDDYPHWNLYCNVQIERPIPSDDALLHNAMVIAAVPTSRLLSTTEPFRFEEISTLLK